MKYDVLIIGAGLAGLTAGSLMAKRGLKVAVIDKSYNPGGSCGTFKRNNVTFDQGSAMLFGFGEKGFNPHRFVFNCLEEPIDVVRHDALYCVNYMDKKIIFWPDVDLFAEELGKAFPSEKRNIQRFYRDLSRLYQHVMVEQPVFSTPDEADRKDSLKQFMKHPLSFAKFLSYMNKSAKDLLKTYFKDPEIFKFFNKLTSTYCYTTVEESPAVLAAIMFVDNHVGGSYYPAGSTVFLPGKLEKVIEANGGQMLMEKEVTRILFEEGKPSGVEVSSGEKYYADSIIYSGTVWNLYGKLIDKAELTEERMKWARNFVPTYPSVVLYAHIDGSVIPEDTLPVEMLIGNPDEIDESEVTVYMFSIDDHTLCEKGDQVVMAIGPSFETWGDENQADYKAKKELERTRLTAVLEKRFPGFGEAIKYSEVATPRTIERFTNKNGGAVAGPKQMIGQHLFKRMHTRSEWDSLYCCGESTVMGTGTPTVTVTGLAAANAVLRKYGLEEYLYKPNMKDYVRIIPKPVEQADLYADYPDYLKAVMHKAAQCQYCEHPECMKHTSLDIRGIMRRMTVGNFLGAMKLTDAFFQEQADCQQQLLAYQMQCKQKLAIGMPVEIQSIINALRNV